MADNIPVKIKNYYIRANETENIDTMKVSNKIAELVYGTQALSKKHYAIICSTSEIDALVASPFAMYIENQNADCPILVTTKSNTLKENLYSKLSNWSGDDNLFEEIYVIGRSELIPDTCIGTSGTNGNMDINGNIYTRKNTKTSSDFSNGELLKYTTKVIRMFGSNRFLTSIKIAEKIENPTYLFFANGLEYIDAYSISVAASYLKSPLILLPENYSKNSEDASSIALTNYLESYANKKTIKKVFIAGGNQRNFQEAEEAIRDILQLTMPNSIERVAGQDRYDTSLSIAKEFKDFLTNTNETKIYTREQLSQSANEKKCSRLIIIGGDTNTNDCPTIPILAVKYKCPLIINSFQLKPRLIEGYLSNNKKNIYRDSAKTDEIIISNTGAEKKSYYIFKDLAGNTGSIYYYWDNNLGQYVSISATLDRDPKVHKGYKEEITPNSGKYNIYKDKNHTEQMIINPNGDYSPFDLYIDIDTNLVLEADLTSIQSSMPLKINTEAASKINIKPQHRYYNLMSYLQIKRPQWIYCFSDSSIGLNTASESGKSFENFVKFYNGTLRVSGEQNFDIQYGII